MVILLMELHEVYHNFADAISEYFEASTSEGELW
jgi:hypothetical protein